MIDEHTPAPSPSRGIYGFALFILMNFCTFAYFVWMLLPSEIIKYLPYEPPQTYWGVAVPIYLCTTLFLFAFCIYPSLHGLHDGVMDDLSVLTDPDSVPVNYFDEKRAIAAEKARKRASNKTKKTKHSRPTRQSSSSNIAASNPNDQTEDLSSRSRTWSIKEIEAFECYQQKLKQQGGGGFGPDANNPIPAVSDMDLDYVCQLLYLFPEFESVPE